MGLGCEVKVIRDIKHDYTINAVEMISAEGAEPEADIFMQIESKQLENIVTGVKLHERRE